MFPLATAALRNITFFAHAQDVFKMALSGGVRFKQKLARNVLPHPPSQILLSQIWSPQKVHPREKYFGMMNRLLKKWLRVKIQNGKEGGRCYCFLLAQVYGR
jgi:hypothetical protein